jgi:hypothetical protein
LNCIEDVKLQPAGLFYFDHFGIQQFFLVCKN